MPDSQSKARTSSGAIYVVAQGCSSRSAPIFLLLSLSSAGRIHPKERIESPFRKQLFHYISIYILFITVRNPRSPPTCYWGSPIFLVYIKCIECPTIRIKEDGSRRVAASSLSFSRFRYRIVSLRERCRSSLSFYFYSGGRSTTSTDAVPSS